jgi:hypothetical protein
MSKSLSKKSEFQRLNSPKISNASVTEVVLNLIELHKTTMTYRYRLHITERLQK